MDHCDSAEVKSLGAPGGNKRKSISAIMKEGYLDQIVQFWDAEPIGGYFPACRGFFMMKCLLGTVLTTPFESGAKAVDVA